LLSHDCIYLELNVAINCRHQILTWHCGLTGVIASRYRLTLAVYFAHRSTISASKKLIELRFQTRDTNAIDVGATNKGTQAIGRESSAFL